METDQVPAGGADDPVGDEHRETHTHRVAWGCEGSRGGGTEPPQSPEWGWEGPSHVPGLHPDSEAPQTLFQLEGHVHPKAALSAG